MAEQETNTNKVSEPADGGQSNVSKEKISDHARGILQIARDTEFLHSFLRTDDDEGERPHKKEERKHVEEPTPIVPPVQHQQQQSLLQQEEEEQKRQAEQAAIRHRQNQRRGKKPPKQESEEEKSAGKTTFSQLTKEMKLRKASKKGRKRAAKVRMMEESYTDKDRAAAANMGSHDIKQSLKMKRRQDRTRALQIPEEADPGALLALGSHEMRSGDVSIAISFVHKALQLNPKDKNALVARSKCYLLLGEPQLALKDAETALQGDKNFIRADFAQLITNMADNTCTSFLVFTARTQHSMKRNLQWRRYERYMKAAVMECSSLLAIYQKAESLYHLGDFEHSLMYYHRGLRIRPELEGFRLGVQKAQEAIENTIGKQLPQASESLSPVPPVPSNEGSAKNRSVSSKSRSSSAASKQQSRKLLGELCVDKDYLEQLLKHPDIKCMNKQDDKNVIASYAQEGIAFLSRREEFWRQQRPNNSTARKVKKQQNVK